MNIQGEITPFFMSCSIITVISQLQITRNLDTALPRNSLQQPSMGSIIDIGKCLVCETSSLLFKLQEGFLF